VMPPSEKTQKFENYSRYKLAAVLRFCRAPRVRLGLRDSKIGVGIDTSSLAGKSDLRINAVRCFRSSDLTMFCDVVIIDCRDHVSAMILIAAARPKGLVWFRRP
jgi:hypothetical protein